MDARHEAELHCPYRLVLVLDQTGAMTWLWIKFDQKDSKHFRETKKKPTGFEPENR